MSEPDRLDARLPFSGRKRKSEKFLRSSSLSRPINTALLAFKYYDIAKPMTYLPATLFAAPGVANRQWLKSLGPELEKVVREESRKAEEVFGEWNINDIKSKEEVCTSDASKADWIASATKRTITEKMDEDPAFYRQFSELLDTSIPSLSSSPWIRGAPHNGFAMLMARINWRSSSDTAGRPGRAWTSSASTIGSLRDASASPSPAG